MFEATADNLIRAGIATGFVMAGILVWWWRGIRPHINIIEQCLTGGGDPEWFDRQMDEHRQQKARDFRLRAASWVRDRISR